MRRSKRLQEKAMRQQRQALAPVHENENHIEQFPNGSKLPATVKDLVGNIINSVWEASGAIVTTSQFDNEWDNDGPKYALHILPYDVWIHILGLLQNPIDRYNVMNTCQVFEQILRPTMTTWLFPAVLPLLVKDLGKAGVLKCRPICKLWRNGLDEVIENAMNPQIVPKSANTAGKEEEFRTWINAQFRAIIKMEANANQQQNSWMQLMPRLYQHPKNPIIGRSVVFRYNETRWDARAPSEMYWMNARRTLRALGDHLWHVEFDDGVADRFSNTDLQLFNKLHRCLTRLPNLKSLRISKLAKLYGNWEPRQQRMQVALTQYPLPVLPHLSALILSATNIPEFMQTLLILRYAVQLQKLECVWAEEFHTRVLDITRAPNLLQLSINHVPPYETILRSFRRFFEQTPKLNLLALAIHDTLYLDRLTLRQATGKKGWNMDSFLHIISKLPRLEILHLEYPNQFVWENCQYNELKRNQIPSLKKIHLIEIPGIGYDFLECFPNLEKLCVKMVAPKSYGHRRDDVGSRIQITEHLYLSTIRKSNIWTILGKLQVVHFQRIWQPFNYDCNYNNRGQIQLTKSYSSYCTRRVYEKWGTGAHLKKSF